MKKKTRQLRRLTKGQQAAFRYALSVNHPMLFAEPRTGKCLVTIRIIKTYKPINPAQGMLVLIVSPVSAIGDWIAELHQENETCINVLTGDSNTRKNLLNEKKKWNIINHEGYISLLEIGDTNWDVVVLDESVVVKNPKAQITRFFLRNFKKCIHRFILSGLPDPNHILDLFCQILFARGQAFGFENYWHFRAEMFEQPWRFAKFKPKIGTMSVIRNYLAKQAFFLLQKDGGINIERKYRPMEITLPDEVQTIYDKIETEFAYEINGKEESTSHGLKKYLWLRQLTGGFLNKKFIHPAKINVIIDLLKDEYRKEPVVIWFAFNNELFEVFKMLRKHKIKARTYTGAIKKFSERKAITNAFDSGKFDVLCAQGAIGQYSINLSRANTAIFYSNTASQTIRKQCEERIIHMKKICPVVYIDLIVPNTVDSDIVELVRQKRKNTEGTFISQIKLQVLKRRIQNAGK